MPQLRCPYCNKTFTQDPAPAHCPHCAKAFVVPARLRKTSFRERQRMRDKIARDADRQRRQSFAPEDLRLGRRPAVLGGIVLFLLLLGGLLVGRLNRITAPRENQRFEREDRAGRELYALRAALERFHRDTGRYPSSKEGLRALVLDPGIPGWNGNYVNVVKPDPWRTPYRYALTPDGPDLRSCGPDRQPFTEDDLLADAPDSGFPEDVPPVK